MRPFLVFKKNNKNSLRTYNMPCARLFLVTFIASFAVQNNLSKYE